MTILTEHLVLSEQQTLDSTHQRAALTGKVRGSFALECGLKQVTCTDTDTKGQCLLLGLPRSVLVNGIRAVQTATLAEHRAQRGTRTLRSHHDNIDILGRNNTRAVTPVDCEAVAVVQRLAGLQILLDGGPLLHLTSVRKQHAEDSTLLSSLLDREECLARYPTVSNGLVIGLALTLANDDVETIVAQVASLSRTLHTITDDGNNLILQYFTCFLKRELLAGDYSLDNATKIHFCHNCNYVLMLYLSLCTMPALHENRRFIGPLPPCTRMRRET